MLGNFLLCFCLVDICRWFSMLCKILGFFELVMELVIKVFVVRVLFLIKDMSFFMLSLWEYVIVYIWESV